MSHLGQRTRFGSPMAWCAARLPFLARVCFFLGSGGISSTSQLKVRFGRSIEAWLSCLDRQLHRSTFKLSNHSAQIPLHA